MFFDRPEDVLRLVNRHGTTLLVVPKNVEIKIKRAMILQPEDKSVITIEQVRQMQRQLLVKQTAERYIVVRPAEALNEEAANAFLKSLEEPSEKVHFVLVTEQPALILPTLLSRASVYVLRQKWAVDAEIRASDQDKMLAKKLIAARPADLVEVAETIARQKDGARQRALLILGIAIEMAYKTYLINHKVAFLDKVPKLLRAYDSIAKNGHVKLHLISDLC